MERVLPASGLNSIGHLLKENAFTQLVVQLHTIFAA